ncbi:MAG: hypothetical protein JXQ90_14355 [Cyclobacteriaceae bacterium]
MRALLSLMAVVMFTTLNAQGIVTELIQVDSQKKLEIDFPFADEIRFERHAKRSVEVKAIVNINDGEDNEMFSIKHSVDQNRIVVKMDKDKWDNYAKTNKKKCWNSDIKIVVSCPNNMDLHVETISGDLVLTNSGTEDYLKTISGDIDLTSKAGIDFKAKTISGEVYSDIEIEYPKGKDGLSQLVGMDVYGSVNGGGNLINLETISGDILLRKGQ